MKSEKAERLPRTGQDAAPFEDPRGVEIVVPTPNADDLITLQQASQVCGLSADTLRDAAREGRLPAWRVGPYWLTTRRQLHRFLMGRRRGSPKPLPPTYQAPEPEEARP